MGTNKALNGVWIFGDYRNYFQNRVTLQLIAKGKDLATKRNTKVPGHRKHRSQQSHICVIKSANPAWVADG